MKRLILLLLLLAFTAPIVAPAFAHHVKGHRKRVVVRNTPRRTVVVVHRGFPIRRTMPVVVVRPARVAAIQPAVFLAPVIWVSAVVTRSPRERRVWEDDEVLNREDGWTDFALHCGERGDALFLEIEGRVQLNFAEVVFANGEAMVVDFRETTRKDGIYRLIDFRDGRKVDHVRMVARAKSPDARVVLRLER
jgi:hypothetical protein